MTCDTLDHDMADLLQRYRDKRDFSLTPEPKGRAAKAGRTLSFVVQKHAASRLHYDFRLELGGTLKSWAVPKGPSFDPSDKRMAVQVEDHPLSYGGFEGVIPPGQYGAGTVIVWDRGSWEPIGDPAAGYAAGKLKFVLRGEKLHGAWTLVRMHGRADERQPPWLLIKERDEFARPAAQFDVVEELPDSVLSGSKHAAGFARKVVSKAAKKPDAKATKTRARAAARGAKTKASALPAGAQPAELPLAFSPQLATLVDRAPPGDDWIYEIKFDGYRLLARIDAALRQAQDGRDVRLFTRNGNDWTSRMEPIAQAVRALGLPSGWLDGEIVVHNKDGAPDFNALQNAFDSSRTERIVYCLFDLPYFDGHDLRQVPLVERRALLRRLLEGKTGERIRYSEDFSAPPEDILQHACRLKLEGVIGKRRDSVYVSRRSPSWIKLKCTHRQEFVIVGYTDPEGGRVGIGSLLLAIHDEAGELRYAGKVGTGFDTAALKSIEKQLKAMAVDKTPLVQRPAEARGHWVSPKLVAEVSFSEWTPDGRIRHSVFHGLRSDKPAAAIGKETPLPAKVVAQKAAATRAPRKSAPRSAPPEARKLPDLPKDLRITHPERVIDPSTGLTKQDLVNYYLHAAKRMLPHLHKRPVALVRAPSGIAQQLFFQKHAQTLKIPDITLLDPSFDPGHPPMIAVESFTALVGAAQMNVVEFHTWNARTNNIDKPDRMTFDLDPGEGVAWPAMQEAAQLTRALLAELGLKSFLKTSGGKGLHVVVPLTPRDDWDTVKAFSQAVVQHLAKVVPQRFVAKSGPKNRVGKIFADYLRNGRGATTAAAFSARARPGLGVSIPVSWDELPDLTSGAHWTIANAHERLETDEDPWAEYARTRQTLAKAMKTLGVAR